MVRPRALPDLLLVQALTSPLLRFRLGGSAIERLDARPPGAGSAALEMSRLSQGDGRNRFMRSEGQLACLRACA